MQEEELEKLIAADCIEPSSSPHVSGLVLVHKNDGILCACVCGLLTNQPGHGPKSVSNAQSRSVSRCY